MKILMLDPEKNVSHRISKDTNGGYGTGNNFGDKLIPIFLKRTLKKIHDWPAMHAVYSMSVLKRNGHQVDYSKTIPSDLEDYDFFIVITSIVCCETECNYIKKISILNKKIYAIGPFATNNPSKYIDAGATVICGEPEFFFLKNKNIVEVKENKIIHFEHDFDLDDLPYPDWNSVVTNNNDSMLFGSEKSLPIIGTRGCPYSCFKYCVYPLQQGRKTRQRNATKIIDEIEYWNTKFNIKSFTFRDPVFSINKKHTIEFCEELINRNLKIRFVIETHLRILDRELIKILKQAGLKGVIVGVESGDEEVLKNANRFTIKKDEQFEKIRELEKNHILVSAMFIIGFPTDTEKSVMRTINYAKKLNTTYSQFSIWTPYPGTPVFKEYEDKITAINYEEFDQYNLVFKHDIFTKKKIRELLSKSYTMYYGRFSWLLKYFKNFFLA
ncbi:radical SAM protein [Candidatus Pelagibacter sp.]|nr:radical SAM protein [Candidatus Pelagibacter sp.]